MTKKTTIKQYNGSTFDVIHPETETSMIVDFNTNNFIQKELFFTKQINNTDIISPSEFNLEGLFQKRYLFLYLELFVQQGTVMSTENTGSSTTIYVTFCAYNQNYTAADWLFSFNAPQYSTGTLNIENDTSRGVALIVRGTDTYTAPPFSSGSFYLNPNVQHLAFGYKKPRSAINFQFIEFSKPVTFNIWGYK